MVGTLQRRALLQSAATLMLVPRGVLAQSGHPSAKLAEVLPQMRRAHPRLLMTDAALHAALEKASADKTYAALISRIVREAETILLEPVVRYQLTGVERPHMLAGAREIVRKIVFCSFAWRWTREARFASRAKDEMMSAARFPEWNHTHFLDVAETAFGVAIGYDWIYSTLSQAERDVIRMALVEKSLLWGDRAYRGTDDGWLAFPSYSWNWNPVCNGGMIAAAIAVAESDPLLCRDIIAGATASLPRALADYGPDGAGPEGPVYWTYGTQYYALSVAMIETALGSDMGLTNDSAFSKTDEYRMWVQGPTGKAFNYGDSKEFIAPNSMLAWLASRNRNQHLAALAHREMLAGISAHKLSGEFDRFFPFYAIWYPRTVSGKADLPLAAHFRGDAEIACFRASWTDRTTVFLGFKVGANPTNHSHQDLGSFVLEGQGVRWSSDLGPDSYQLPGYFDAKTPTGGRFEIFRVNASAHSTLTPDGVNQDIYASASITRFLKRKDGGFAVADLSSVYPGYARSVRRGVDFAEEGRRITIRDEIRGARGGKPWRWAMLSAADIKLSGNTAILTMDGKVMEVRTNASGAHFERLAAMPSTKAENQNDGFGLLVLRMPPDAVGNLDIEVELFPLGGTGPKRPAASLDEWR